MPDLTLNVTGDSADAVSAMGDVGSAARGMATEVDVASAGMDTATARMDVLAESGDNVASKASQATGAFGALAGGLEAVGFEGAAAGLQGLAIGTDVASGAGDALNLVMDTQAGRFIAAKAATIAHGIATGAQAVVTGTMTAAQWALNAAMSASPIGLVVVAVAALAAGLVIAYNKSETFRDIVDAAMGVVSDAVGAVGDGIEAVIDWVGKADKGWEAIQTAAENALDPVASAVGAVSTALETAVGWVKDLVDWIGKIDFPDIDIPGVNLKTAQGTQSPFTTPATLTTPTAPAVNLNVYAALQDQDTAMRTLVQGLTDYFARQGLTLSITQPAAV